MLNSNHISNLHLRTFVLHLGIFIWEAVLPWMVELGNKGNINPINFRHHILKWRPRQPSHPSGSRRFSAAISIFCHPLLNVVLSMGGTQGMNPYVMGKIGISPAVQTHALHPANATGGKNEREFATATPTNIGGKNWNLKLQQSLQRPKEVPWGSTPCLRRCNFTSLKNTQNCQQNLFPPQQEIIQTSFLRNRVPESG